MCLFWRSGAITRRLQKLPPASPTASRRQLRPCKGHSAKSQVKASKSSEDALRCLQPQSIPTSDRKKSAFRPFLGTPRKFSAYFFSKNQLKTFLQHGAKGLNWFKPVQSKKVRNFSLDQLFSPIFIRSLNGGVDRVNCTGRSFYGGASSNPGRGQKFFWPFFWPFLALPNQNIAQNGAKNRFQNFHKTRASNRQPPDYETGALVLSHPASIETRSIFYILIFHCFLEEKLTA